MSWMHWFRSGRMDITRASWFLAMYDWDVVYNASNVGSDILSLTLGRPPFARSDGWGISHDQRLSSCLGQRALDLAGLMVNATTMARTALQRDFSLNVAAYDTTTCSRYRNWHCWCEAEAKPPCETPRRCPLYRLLFNAARFIEAST